MKAILVLITLLCISGCTSEKQNRLYEFYSCFDNSQQKGLFALQKSYHKFLKSNFLGSRKNMFLAVDSDKDWSGFEFDRLDSILYQNLVASEFLKISYSEGPEFTAENLENYTKRIQKKVLNNEIENRTIVIREIFANHLECLITHFPKDSTVSNYYEIITDVYHMSPYVFSAFLLNHLDKNESLELLDHIFIIDYYYFVLKRKFE